MHKNPSARGFSRQILIVLLCSLGAFTPACGPLTPEASLGEESGSADEATVEASESAVTYDGNGRAFEGRYERLGRDLLLQRARQPGAFEKLLTEAFGNYDSTAAEGLRRRILAGDFSWAPAVYLVGSETLGDRAGGYSATRKVVFLHEQLPNRYVRSHVYLEELGHHIETLLRTSDTPGDEGALFRMALVGETFIPFIHEEIKRDDHLGMIVVDGKMEQVELLWGWDWVKDKASKAWGGIKGAAEWVWGGARTAGEAVREYAKKGYNASKLAAVWVYEHADVAADKFVEACVRQGVAYYQTALNGINMVYAATRGTWEGAKLIYEAGNQLRQGNFKDAGAALVIGLAKLAVEMPLDVAVGSILESVSILQTAMFLEPIGRTLRSDERSFLSQVFGDSPWWFNVIRVKEGFAGLFSISSRPFTLESTIYLKNAAYSPQLMVHETTHVWQWIHGGGDYKLASIHEQIAHGKAAYEFEPELKAGKTWPDLGVEQQANFVDEAFAAPAECFAFPASPCKVKSEDRTGVFLATREALRSGRGAP